ncbi:peroxiredoxin [Nisaea acidiphila]|uniref:Glutathione-dependent peroxiredoxin n=1 Tax=Nisaea acidiphila TaxID=1862145 RepID=A0A9J7AXZ5_9PROT|nr:peroxiredoxin [Nisaea acidiphila]UUX51942.1 peroxiredoxin [Nisaea acidiphila]
MTIKVGDKIPALTLKTNTSDGIDDLETGAFFKGRKVVLFAVPGAFTPTCSVKHLPGFVEKAGDLKARGVDAIACTSVNDAFVMGAWAKDQKAGDAVTMIADGNAELAKALGLEMDVSVAGMGTRSQRYAMVVEDGTVTKLFVEEPRAFEVSSAEYVLANL